jgi:hypothetical protein
VLGFLATGFPEPTRPFQTHFRPEAYSFIDYLNRLGANLKIPPERSTLDARASRASPGYIGYLSR